MSETNTATVKIRSKSSAAPTRDDVERALDKLAERAAVMRAQTLIVVERQQWRFEQNPTASSPRSDGPSEEPAL